jgi:hypothetical protein
MDKIKELIKELRQEIQSCQMDIAGGNEMNVLDALDSVTEIEQLIILRDSNRISYFTDENSNNVDICASGVNVTLKKDGTHEYFRSYGFAGMMKLTPVYMIIYCIFAI